MPIIVLRSVGDRSSVVELFSRRRCCPPPGKSLLMTPSARVEVVQILSWHHTAKKCSDFNFLTSPVSRYPKLDRASDPSARRGPGDVPASTRSTFPRSLKNGLDISRPYTGLYLALLSVEELISGSLSKWEEICLLEFL